MKNITIYNDDLYTFINNNLEDIKNWLHDDEEPQTDENIQAYAQYYINDDLEQLNILLNAYDEKHTNAKYIIVGVLGLWYGQRIVKNTSFTSLKNAVFKCFEDVNKVYFFNNGTIRIDAAHHDGTNTFKIYRLVNGEKKAIKYIDLYNNF